MQIAILSFPPTNPPQNQGTSTSLPNIHQRKKQRKINSNKNSISLYLKKNPPRFSSSQPFLSLIKKVKKEWKIKFRKKRASCFFYAIWKDECVRVSDLDRCRKVRSQSEGKRDFREIGFFFFFLGSVKVQWVYWEIQTHLSPTGKPKFTALIRAPYIYLYAWEKPKTQSKTLPDPCKYFRKKKKKVFWVQIFTHPKINITSNKRNLRRISRNIGIYGE